MIASRKPGYAKLLGADPTKLEGEVDDFGIPMSEAKDPCGGSYSSVLQSGEGFLVVKNYQHPALYHGSTKEIGDLDLKSGSGQFGPGLYLTPDEQWADMHARGGRQGRAGQRLSKEPGHIAKLSLKAPVAVIVTDYDAFGRQALDDEDAEHAFSQIGDHLSQRVTKFWGKYVQDQLYGATAIVFCPEERSVLTPFNQVLVMPGSEVKRVK